MGVTFEGKIYNDQQSFDLPNDKSGTIALTSDVGASYLVYTALLTQTGTNAPVATVLENTTGAVFTWVRSSEGNYYCQTNIALWPTDADFYWTIGSLFNKGLVCIYNTDNEFGINTFLGTLTDGELYYIPIEIRVYP